MTADKISAEMSIAAHMHCGKCLDSLPNDMSPRDYARLEVGWTVQGLQVWCKRHECNVMHISFEGQKHPVNTLAASND